MIVAGLSTWGWHAMHPLLPRWIGYAGLNVCLPNLMLKVSPRDNNTGYIATFNAMSGLAFAAGSLLGGLAFDRMKGLTLYLFGGTLVLGYFHYVFLFAWITRSLGLLLLLRVNEPRTPDST